MPTLRDIARRGLERLEESVGLTLVDTGYLRVQEAAAVEAFRVAEDLEELGYVAYDSMGGRPNEPSATSRRRWVQKARTVWHTDPQAGAAVELLNEFSLGRGVPKPSAKDQRVQEVIDRFWDNPQNQRVLTSYTGQLRLGNSLSVQSNVFWLIFDEGDDGQVLLSYLAHDTVENAVSDPANRQRVLYFTARKVRQEWDFKADRPKVDLSRQHGTQKLWYYEVWGAVDEALDERGLKGKRRRDKLTLTEAAKDTATKVSERDGSVMIEAKDDDDGPLVLCPADKLGEGQVFHLYENTDMEGIFGIPRMRRTIRWYTAYNEFMGARTDMMLAAAKFIMERTVKGSPRTLEAMATRAMRATSDLQERISSEDTRTLGPRGGANILQQNEAVQHEPMRLDSGAGNAVQDGQMLRAQVSAGDRFPQHYLGDVGSANLAVATSMELPVLKHVEARQELIEGLFRFCIDRAIQRAVDTGQLDPEAEDSEELVGTPEEGTEGETLDQRPMQWRVNGQEVMRETRVVAYPDGSVGYELLREAHEGKQTDEDTTGLDLGYDFGLPSPLKRMMGDVVTACVQTAQAFDPNNTNPELTRTLLTYMFAEAFEMQNAEEVVDRIFPEGYVPPEQAAMQQQGMGGSEPGQPNFFSPEATGMPADPSNPYGAPKKATPPEQVQEAADIRELLGKVITVGRYGQPVLWPGRTPTTGDIPIQAENARDGRIADLDKEFASEMRGATADALQAIHLNGNGNGQAS
jgi:hypothetical protein